MVGTAVVAALALLLGADSAGPSLTGIVLDSSGQPVPEARVGLAMAVPRIGPALFCPSCYLDCAKSTTTDEGGRFEINILNPTLKFRVLCTAPDKKTSITSWYDPSAGPLTIKLTDLPRDLPPERTLRGKLVNDLGLPVLGALIEPVGAKTADRRWGGGSVKVDPAVSDKNGSFVMLLPEGYEGVDLSIEVAGYAGISLELVAPGNEERRIVIPSGTQVVGRLIHDDQPLVGHKVAVVQLERRVGHHFIKAVEATTDEQGKFTFNNLPADEAYAVFTPVAVGPAPLVLTTKRFTAYGNGKSRDLGALDVAPALRLAGRVELPAGQTPPANAKLCLDRDPAWDLISVDIQDDGHFEISGLPPETYELRLVMEGSEIDTARLAYQSTGPNRFGISIKSSVDDLRIPLRPKTTQEPGQ